MNGRVHVLFVDDDERTGDLVERRLENENGDFSVDHVADPVVVPERLEDRAVDCVVSDYRMPGMDGIELLERVRAEWPDLPFVLFTGRGTESVAAEAIAAGATDYVPKELDPDSIAVLANRIENAVESYRRSKRAERIRERYATLMDGSRGLIAVLDANGVITYQSPSVERVLGLERSTVEGSDVFEHVHEADRDAVADALDALVEGRDSAPSFEFRLMDDSGEWRWLEAVGADATDTPVEGYVFNAIEVTERKRQQAELELKNKVIDEASVGITITDPDREDNPMIYANEGFTELTGYDTEEVVGRNCRFLQGKDTEEATVDRIREAVAGGEECTVELRNYRADGTEFWNRLRITPIRDDDGVVTNFVGFQQDVSERKRYERTLSELHGVSRDLLAAESATEMADVATRAAEELLPVDAAAVFLYDQDENALLPAAHAEGTTNVVGEVPTFEAGEGIAWDVFVEGKPRSYEDVSTAEEAYNPESSVAAELLLPLGDQGVFLFGRTEPTAFDGSFVELADVLAANLQEALERTEGERRLRERERELDRRNERLRKLDAINERVRTVCHEIVGASDAEYIYERICSTLSEVDQFQFVCVGQSDPSGRRVTFDHRAGVETGYLSEIDHGIDGAEPTVRGVRTGEEVFVERVASELRSSDWRRPALTRDYRSVVSLPVEDGGVQYGALTVYADGTEALDEETRSVLRSLVQTVGAAVRTTNQREATLGDETVELSFSLSRSASPLVSIGRALDGATSIDAVVAGSGDLRAFGTTTADGDELRVIAREIPGVESAAVLRSSDSTVSFEVTLPETPMLDVVLDHGGSFEGLVVESSTVRLDLSFVDSTDVNGFVELFCRQFPGCELRARRSADPSTSAEDHSLTDRQREALATAYHSGYYDWPRDVDSETVANSMGITKPTFLEHLRRAEERVVQRYLDGGSITNTR